MAEQVPRAVGGWPVRVVDATVINGPGQRDASQSSVQWRAHVLINPATGTFKLRRADRRLRREKLSRYSVAKGEVILGDRGYATARGLHAVWQAEAKVLVRFNPVTLRSCDAERRRIFLQKEEARVR